MNTALLTVTQPFFYIIIFKFFTRTLFTFDALPVRFARIYDAGKEYQVDIRTGCLLVNSNFKWRLTYVDSPMDCCVHKGN